MGLIQGYGMTLVEERTSTNGFAAARKAMVESQLRVSGVNAGFVLARMGAVPREDFVPDRARGHAYMDRAIALGDGRFLAAPLVNGRMLEEAAPGEGDKALLVDGGSGYMAELLRPLVGSLEVVAPDKAAAKSRKAGDFDLLVIDGAIEQLPAALEALLPERWVASHPEHRLEQREEESREAQARRRRQRAARRIAVAQ